MPRPLCSGVTGGSLPVSCTDLREIQYESDLSMSHENVCLQQAGPSNERAERTRGAGGANVWSRRREPAARQV